MLVYRNRSESITIQVFPIEKTEIPELISKPLPNAIVLNYNDHAYFRQIFDDNSTQYLIENADVKNKK